MAAIVTNDNEEIEHIPEELQAYEDFCISSRDWLWSQVKEESNKAAANVFRAVFSSMEALGEGTMEQEKQAANRLSRQLAEPDSPIEEAEGAADEIAVAGLKKIQEQNVAASLVTAFKSVFKTASEAVGHFLDEKMKQL